MKIAFLSDIHGNAVALDAVLDDIAAKGVDQIVVLGDIAFRGPEPKRALELVRSLNATVVKGNVDEWTIRGFRDGEVPEAFRAQLEAEREWTVARLDADDLKYLASLPEQVSLTLTESIKIHAFHATPASLFAVVWPEAAPDVLREQLMKHSDATLYVHGHIHFPYVRFLDGKCVANSGSIGLPFDGSPLASYAIVEGEGDRFRVAIERVPYDVARVMAQYRTEAHPGWELLARSVQYGVNPFELLKRG